VAAEREKRAPLGSVWEVKGVAGSGIEVLVEVGRARVRARGARATKCWVMGARALTCCRRRGGRSSSLRIPGEPAVFLFVLSAG